MNLPSLVFLAAGLSVILLSPLGGAPYRTFTDTDGRTIEAKITDFDPEAGVSLELSNGASFEEVPIARFSQEDRDFIRNWAKEREAARNDAPLRPDSKILITVKRGRDDDFQGGGDPDNRDVRYEPAVEFRNEELDVSFKNLEGTLVLIGQSVLENNEYHVLYREDFTVSLPARETVEWQGKPFNNVYDDNPRNGSAFGAKYDGYLLVLRDNEGEIRMIKCSRTRWEQSCARILKADLRKGHSADFDESFDKTVF